MLHAIKKQPASTKVTAAHVKLSPEGSEENKGISIFDKIVNMGENKRMHKVFSPMKCNIFLIRAGI